MKYCTLCKINKSVSEFYKNSSKKDGLQNYCKSCNTEHVRNRNRSIPDYYSNRNKQNKIKTKTFILNYLNSHSCVDCGETDPVVLEFDHQHSKVIEISKLLNQTTSITTLQKEIDKCEVRCANCHRRKTSRDFGWFKSIPL